jgi:hypothetical protein
LQCRAYPAIDALPTKQDLDGLGVSSDWCRVRTGPASGAPKSSGRVGTPFLEQRINVSGVGRRAGEHTPEHSQRLPDAQSERIDAVFADPSDYARMDLTDATILGPIRQTVEFTHERWLSAELLLDSIRVSNRRDARSAVMAKLDPRHGGTARPLSASVPGRRCSPSRFAPPTRPVLGRAGSNLPPLLLFDICRACPAALKRSVSDDPGG